MGDLVRKLGSERKHDFKTSFDEIVNKYREKADAGGYFGKLKFSKEKSMVVISVELEE
jgi:hypothetical protein